MIIHECKCSSNLHVHACNLKTLKFKVELMNALTVQNPHHKCDRETRMTTEKKIIAEYT